MQHYTILEICPRLFLYMVVCDWPPFDHYCATAPQKAEKACCDNQQRAFSCFGNRCAEPTEFTFLRLVALPCRSSPTRKARGSNPPGRTKSSTLWGAALFVLHGFYGAVKERIRTARAPRLGESLRAHQKTLLRCIFCNEVFLFWFFRIILATYFLPST